MQMLTSSIPCPQCGGDSVVTIFGPNGPDLSRAEVSFNCPENHDVPPAEVLAAWDATRRVAAAS